MRQLVNMEIYVANVYFCKSFVYGNIAGIYCMGIFVHRLPFGTVQKRVHSNVSDAIVLGNGNTSCSLARQLSI